MQQSRGGSHPEYVEGIWQKETKDSTPTRWKAAYELAARGEPSLVFISQEEVVCVSCVLLVNKCRTHAKGSSLIEPVNLVVQFRKWYGRRIS